MKELAIVLSVTVIPAAAFGYSYPGLAMHTVASYEYLYCPDLVEPGSPYFPFDCYSLDRDATMDELDATLGYVYVAFCAYYDDYWEIDGITGAEYCIAGWPGGPDAPPKPTLNYCPESSVVLGDPFEGGGFQSFGQTLSPLSPEWCGLVGFGWFVWNASPYCSHLPIALEFCPSTYTYPADPHNDLVGPGPEYAEVRVVLESGCTIGAGGPTAAEPTTWSSVKTMYR